MTNIKKEYKELIVVDDYLENVEVISTHKIVESLDDLEPFEYSDDEIEGYELDDSVQWSIVKWKGKLILLPTI